MKNIVLAALAIFFAAALAGCQRVPDEQVVSAANAQPRTRVAAKAPTPPPESTVAAPAPRPRDAITDSVITARIKAGILSDPGMAGSDVSVNTSNGVVSLTGIIKSQEQAAIASAHAQRQDGVMRVDNQLAVNLH